MDPASRQCTCSHGNVFVGFLATKEIAVLEHPDYSPDVGPCDFFSVLEYKRKIERKAVE